MHLHLLNLFYFFKLFICFPQDCLAGNVQGVAINMTLTLGFSIPWERGWTVGGTIGSAIVLGIKEVEKRQLLPGYDVEWVWGDTYCEPRQGMQVAVNMWNSVQDLDALIGPVCSIVCLPVSLLATAWNIPLVSWGCTSPSLSDKSLHPTFSRTDGTVLTLGPVFDGLAHMFGWTRVAIITITDELYKGAAEATRVEMENHGREIYFRVMETTIQGQETNLDSLNALKSIMQDIKEQTRIIYLFSHQPDLESILSIALELGMLNGEFVFTTFELCTAIDHVIGINLNPPSGPDFDDFLKQIIEEFQTPIFDDIAHVAANASIHEISYYAGMNGFLLLYSY